jgi:hypothetical protein
MAISTAQIPQLLLPGVRKVKGDYQILPAIWPRIFAQSHSDLQVERTLSMRYLPLAGLKNQGGPVNFDNLAGQRYTYSAIHVAIGLGYSFTRESIDDNLYKSQFDPTNLGLIKSFRQTKEIIGADIFNTGQTYNAAIGGDGVALFATNHPVDGGTVANLPTNQIGLNEASLLYLNNLCRRFRDNAGLLTPAQARLLHVPVELRHVAKRLLESPMRTGTANNDINAVKENGDLADGYLVNDYLTSAYAWFLITDQGGFIYLERVPFETSMQVDFSTDNLLVKAYERYSMSYDDWRAGAGSFPTN